MTTENTKAGMEVIKDVNVIAAAMRRLVTCVRWMNGKVTHRNLSQVPRSNTPSVKNVVYS